MNKTQALTALVSATRQWNPGDELILFGVQNLLRSWLPNPLNWVLYDRNPDLFIDGWHEPTHRENLWTNAFHHRSFAGVDLAVVAGSPEWLGGPMIPFYKGIREYSVPLILLGVGYADVFREFTQDEAYCFDNLAQVITARDRVAASLFSQVEAHCALLPCPGVFASAETSCSTEVRRVAFILQSHKTQNQQVPAEVMEGALRQAARLQRMGYETEFVCFYIDETIDLLKEFMLPVRYSYDARDYIGILRDYDVVVSSRLHGAILANSLGKPAILFNRELRCEGAAEHLPFVSVADVDDIVAILQSLDLDAIGRDLPEWKAAVWNKYMALLSKVDVPGEGTRFQSRLLRSRVWELSTALDDGAAGLRAAEVERAASEHQTEELARDVADTFAKLRAAEASLDELKREGEGLHAELALARKQLSECQAAMQAMKASMSWRVAEWLRERARGVPLVYKLATLILKARKRRRADDDSQQTGVIGSVPTKRRD